MNVLDLQRLTVLDPDGGLGLVDKVVASFLRDAVSAIEAIRAAHERGDRAQIARLAHTLRGASLNVGAERLARCCGELEHGGGSIDSLDPELREIRQALERRRESVA
ncbi:MAG TPA: Hpt domain-containing protein [Candidatus Polarisedimenticolaceae bacterium]|nr:Hpt domain-containing protein [Candidatus Polarisedimenticolaceae bacterium]